MSIRIAYYPVLGGTLSHRVQPLRSSNPSVVNSILVSLRRDVGRPKVSTTSSNVLAPSNAYLEGRGNLLAERQADLYIPLHG